MKRCISEIHFTVLDLLFWETGNFHWLIEAWILRMLTCPDFFFAGAPEWGFFSTYISDTAQKYGLSDIDLVQCIVMAALTESLLRIF